MRNQIQMAEQIGVHATTINSSNPEEWADIEEALQAGTVDLLLVSPERFANEDFRREVLPLLAQGSGLFVIDEAHCISDSMVSVPRNLQALNSCMLLVSSLHGTSDRTV